MRSNRVKLCIKGLVILLVLGLGIGTHGEEEAASEGATQTPRQNQEARKNREFQEKTDRLKILEARITGYDKELLLQVKKKNLEKDPGKQKVILDQMVALIKDRNKDGEESNKIKAELAMRFPTQGSFLDRRYKTQSRKTIEDIEGSAGLDELLTRTKKMVDRKYAPFNPPPAVLAPEEAKHQAAPAVEEEKPAHLRLER